MTDEADPGRPQPAQDLPRLTKIEDFSSSLDIDWPLRQQNPVRRVLNFLERVSLGLERPVVRWVGRSELNPLYHTGTLTVFFCLVILVTGIYLTMFYPLGFEASYQGVARIEANLLGRVMRALHRYASDAAIIVALLHGWRTFFMDRFRGPRWLAWVTGVVMTGVLWFIGLTGYWMVMDARTGLMNQTLVDLLRSSAAGANFLIQTLVGSAAEQGLVFVILLITLHLGLSALVGLFLWLHLKRLKRAKWLPPRYWMVGFGVLLFVAALLVPAGMLPPGELNRIPVQVDIDLFYLAYLPLVNRMSPDALCVLGLLLLGMAALAPWLLKRKALPPVKVDAERCTGCTLCAADCPYKAVRMVPRVDGKRPKYVAEVDPKYCVACGICIGACQPLALSLTGKMSELKLGEAVAHRASAQPGKPVKVVFTCERHAAQGAKLKFQSQDLDEVSSDELVFPLVCIGMAHPGLAVQVLEAGAAEVKFIGCPPEDCANREGNLWLQQRIERKRLPKLKVNYSNAPIFTDWRQPDDFHAALRSHQPDSQASTYGIRLTGLSWQRFIPALVLLVLCMAVQVLLSRVNYHPIPNPVAIIEIVMRHQSGLLLQNVPTSNPAYPEPQAPLRLVMEIDDVVLLDREYASIGRGSERITPVLEQVHLEPGEYILSLRMYDREDDSQFQVIFAGSVKLENGEVLRLEYQDVRLGGDSSRGQRLYEEREFGVNAGCINCHSLEPGLVLVGPSFSRIASRAETRVAELSAEEYLRQSILEPNAFIVEGFQPGQMYPVGEQLTPEQVDDLLAFLLTLK